MGEKSKQWLERARRRIPGGVNSPVRAYRAVGGDPPVLSRALGATVWDVDDNAYLDYVGSWGPMILGHAHPKVVEAVRERALSGLSFGAPTELEADLAEVIVARVPSLSMVRLVNSGTEATMSALRLARAFTGRDRVVKFEGCYHGHGDPFLIQAGSGAATLGVPDSPGVPAAVVRDTLSAPYNDLERLADLFRTQGDAIAAVIVEPVAGNMGLVPPSPGFLEGLRKLTGDHGALLIFDEVMTGFRLAPGGAQELYDIDPDLTTMGKIVGGGMPIGAYGGRREIMEQVSPAGPMYQAGTLSGNPIAVAAGLTTLRLLESDPPYARLEQLGARLEAGTRAMIQRQSLPLCFQRVGSMYCLYFTPGPVRNYAEAKGADTEGFAAFFRGMLERGIYQAPSQFETGFLCAAHTEADIDRTLAAAEEVLTRR